MSRRARGTVSFVIGVVVSVVSVAWVISKVARGQYFWLDIAPSSTFVALGAAYAVIGLRQRRASSDDD